MPLLPVVPLTRRTYHSISFGGRRSKQVLIEKQPLKPVAADGGSGLPRALSARDDSALPLCVSLTVRLRGRHAQTPNPGCFEGQKRLL